MTQLLIWPTDVSSSLANWHLVLIGQLISATYWSMMSATHWSMMSAAPLFYNVSSSRPSDVSCSLANWCQLLIGELTSAAHWPTHISWSLDYSCQLLIGQVIPAAHWPTDAGRSLANCFFFLWWILYVFASLPLGPYLATPRPCPRSWSWVSTRWPGGVGAWPGPAPSGAPGTRPDPGDPGTDMRWCVVTCEYCRERSSSQSS